MQQFLGSCSERTRYLRYGELLSSPPPDDYVFFMDAGHQSVVTVVAVDNAEQKGRIVAAAKFHGRKGADVAEFSLIVRDDWQGQGVGTALLDYLIEAARLRGVKGFEAYVSSRNPAMLALIRRLPYVIESSIEGDQYFYRFYFDTTRGEHFAGV